MPGTLQYGIDAAIAEAYADSLNEHIRYVQEAAVRIGMDAEDVLQHDDSKWSLAEFPGYALHFKGGGAPDRFAKAWLHHIHNNSHHWQYWIFADGFTPKGSTVENGVVEMPPWCVVEMVADWMGASRAYTGSWDMAEWLGENLPKIRLHSRSWVVLEKVLRGLPEGYHNILNELKINGLL